MPDPSPIERYQAAERPWVIYRLLDPDTLVPRYVGKVHLKKRDLDFFSVKPKALDRRIKQHIAAVGRGAKYRAARWIGSILSDGKSPFVQLLQRGRGDGWQDAEMFWIREYRFIYGDLIVNATDGGDGALGYLHSEENKKRMSRIKSETMRMFASEDKEKFKRIVSSLAEGSKKSWLDPDKRKAHSSRVKDRWANPSSRSVMLDGIKKSWDNPERHIVEGAEKKKFWGDPKNRERMICAQKRASAVPARRAHLVSMSKMANKASTDASSEMVLCVETGEVFPSARAAARIIGVDFSRVWIVLNRGGKTRGLTLVKYDGPQSAMECTSQPEMI